MNPRATTIAVAVALAVLTLVVFAPVATHEFVAYDDTAYVTDNPRVQQGVTLANLWWGLTTLDAGYWHPLTWWSHMLDCELFGLWAGGHHVTSIVLHAVAAVLLFAALATMTGAPAASGFVAALFALHPLHVESVAYVAQRKDVLSGVGWMLTLLAYAHYVRVPSRGRYAAVVGAFVLGLMAKPMVVTLPAVLLLLDFWPLRRLSIPVRDGVLLRRVVAEKLPLLVLAAIGSVATTSAASRIGAVADLATIPVERRLANAVVAYATYLAKTAWPANLACFYPYPSAFDAGLVALAATALVLVSAAAVLLARRLPYVAVGWFWYLGTLVPVIGLVQVGEHAMADRYTYLPLVGLFIAITWAACDAGAGRRHGGRVLAGAAALVLAACVVKTRAELAHWRDSTALFEHALAVTERNHVAHNNLGLVLREEGRPADAMAHFAAALDAMPGYAAARNHLGLTQRDLGQPVAAIASFAAAIELAPDYAAPRFNLGETLLAGGDEAGAIARFEETIRLDPTHAAAHLQLSPLLLARGRRDEAADHARHAVALRPDSAEAHAYLADALAVAGRMDDAIAHYRTALHLEPGDADAHYNLGNALAASGRLDEAIDEYQRTVTLAPDYAEAHNNLGRALFEQGKLEDALARYSEALRLSPNLPTALQNRATAYRRLGRPQEAAADLERLRALDGPP